MKKRIYINRSMITLSLLSMMFCAMPAGAETPGAETPTIKPAEKQARIDNACDERCAQHKGSLMHDYRDCFDGCLHEPSDTVKDAKPVNRVQVK